MLGWIDELVAGSNSFMPHGSCFLWQPAILWLHVLSDVLIGMAYFSIPFALFYFAYKRNEIVFRWVFVVCGVFILLCGITHLLNIWSFWHADYWLEGFVKLATALISIVTAILIWPLMPKLLQVPSPAALQTSETFLRVIFDATPDAMLISNVDGVITMVNHQAELLLGYAAAELLGQPIDMLVPERFRAAHVGLRENFAAAPLVRRMGLGRVVQALKKQGGEIDVEISLSPIHTNQGLFFASALRDVTLQKQTEAALKASEQRFRRMADVSPAMIWITDVQGNPSFVNHTWLNFTGLDFNTAMSHEGWLKHVHPDDRSSVFLVYYKNIHARQPILTEYRLQRAQGDWRWILDHGVPMYNENGEFSGYIGSAIDITERKQAEAEFRIAATAFESQEAMVITDTNTVILRVNKMFTDSTGYTAEEAVGNKMNLLKSDRQNAAFYAAMWDSISQTGMWQGEIWDKRKNGEVYPKWLTITAVRDAKGVVTHYVGTHIDISERKAAEDEIKNLAFYDPLTQLPNRRLLRDRLHQALVTHSRNAVYGALLFIDLDNFKTLNDTLGHDQGDYLLQQVAKRLVDSVRECDTVARFGGDEFVVMLEELSEQTTEAAIHTELVAAKILLHLNKPYLIDGRVHHSTPSIGATLFGDQASSIDELLKQADIAMYQAKASGRNMLKFFDPSMQASISARANLEEKLRIGLREKQFLLHYQPQVNGDHQVVGAEALIRWQDSAQTMVGPAEFIPLAEETGLILPIGQWVLETACAQLVKWAAQPVLAHLSISVNVSVRQFRQDDFVAQVLEILKQSGANPAMLKLELTESLLAFDVENIIQKMTALKQAGVVFALDDFGTGFSSLYYLKQLPLDQLKIDQSFVRDILTDANDAAIAKMIIALAASMGLQVLAEGVEQEAQRAFLAGYGCYDYQGYLFSKPLAIAEFENLLLLEGGTA